MTVSPAEPTALGPATVPVPACPVCGGAVREPLFRAPDRLYLTPGEFAYSRCRGCWSVYQEPRVADADLPGCYPVGYYTHAPAGAPPAAEAVADPGGDRFRDRLRRAVASAGRGEPAGGWLGRAGRLLAAFRGFRERASCYRVPDELLPTRPRPGRALDIGCGNGQLLSQLRVLGWEAEGIEWHPAAAAAAAAASGCPVRAGDFTTLDLGRYDLVVMSHVLEHIPDTAAVLGRVRELLADGGRAVFVYPNPQGLPRWVYGPHYFQWDPPRHLVLPTMRALAAAGRRAGLVPDRIGARVLNTRGVRTFYAMSRYFARGQVGNPDPPPPITARERWLVRLEVALTGVGFPVGTDVVAVFRPTRGAGR